MLLRAGWRPVCVVVTQQLPVVVMWIYADWQEDRVHLARLSQDQFWATLELIHDGGLTSLLKLKIMIRALC